MFPSPLSDWIVSMVFDLRRFTRVHLILAHNARWERYNPQADFLRLDFEGPFRVKWGSVRAISLRIGELYGARCLPTSRIVREGQYAGKSLALNVRDATDRRLWEGVRCLVDGFKTSTVTVDPPDATPCTILQCIVQSFVEMKDLCLDNTPRRIYIRLNVSSAAKCTDLFTPSCELFFRHCLKGGRRSLGPVHDFKNYVVRYLRR
jgi:hypothetical protein